MSVAVDGDERVSFYDSPVQQCPFPIYDQLRIEHPVYVDPKTGNYVLTRYEDVRRVLLNHKQFSNKTGLLQTRDTPTTVVTNKMFEERGWLPLDTLVSNDPPSHRQYRTLVDKAFSPTKIVALETRIAEICDALIDSFIDRPEIDFVSEFAIKLPMTMIAEQLGVAAEDMDRFKRWSDLGVESTNPILTPEREIATTVGVIELQNYMSDNAARFRANPDETKLLSRLVHAEVDGRQLEVRAFMSIIQQLLVAGNEMTTAALAAGMKLLIDHPELVDRLEAEPDRLKTFVEETLRVLAPVQALFRRVLTEAVIDGVTIPQGAIVEVRFGAANQDPAMFDRPGCADLDRANANAHMAFGAGIHLCIGNQLARGELRVAFARLIDRMKSFRASRGEDSYAYSPTFVTYAISTLWMSFERR